MNTCECGHRLELHGVQNGCMLCDCNKSQSSVTIELQTARVTELEAALNSSTDLLNLAQHQVPNQADAMLMKSKVDSNLALLAKPVTEKAAQ
jgi:hypothetical protein